MKSQCANQAPVSTAVSRALFLPTSSVTDSPLCFNKAYFSQANFNVDRFVNLARRRANLVQIQNDLRLYLKLVQNSMIELINDDYADFVNLSSSLVGLKDTIDKLEKDIESIWNDFCMSTKKLMGTAEFIEKEAADLCACRSKQIELRSSISFINALERVSSCLSAEPEVVDSFWLSQLTDALVSLVIWYRRLPSDIDEKWTEAFNTCRLEAQHLCERFLIADLQAECHLTRSLLGILSLLDTTDQAVSIVMDEVIEPKVHYVAEDLHKMLETILDSVLQTRNLWLKKIESWSGHCSFTMSFLDKCLLTYVVSSLDQHFGSVLVPSDSLLFHRCYKTICSFISNWPDSKRSRTILRMIRDRFNLVVYFKLETHRFLDDFSDCSVVEKLRLLERDVGDSGTLFWFPCTKVVYEALTTVWSDESFLPSLTDKYWDFSTKMLKSYLDWLASVFRYLESNKDGVDGMESWRLLCALCADCTVLDSSVFELGMSSILERIRSLEIDTALFGQCLTVFSTVMEKQRGDLAQAFGHHVTVVLNAVFDGVGDIPRHYRWTKKPMPTEASQYVIDAFNKFDAFKAEAVRCGWNEDDIDKFSSEVMTKVATAFCGKAEEVIESVEQTGTSLQRFKRKGAFSGSSEVSSADSDENKIRSQLNLDLSFFRMNAAKYQVDCATLDALIVRAINPSSLEREAVRGSEQTASSAQPSSLS